LKGRGGGGRLGGGEEESAPRDLGGNRNLGTKIS